ncbi:MAG: hypothetical protein C0433_13925 [Cyclobacterium sp.]|nr:hypothetical protein [Cyclobacterium sp.]
MRRFLFLGFAFAILACSKNQKPTAIQYFELSDLITDTLYLEKDTLTKELGSTFAYFETDSGQVLLTFRDNRLLF